MMRWIVLAVLCMAAPALGAEPVEVVGVTDGDTIKVILRGEQVRVRLHGIDAPERKQPFGQASTRMLGEFLRGRQVTIEPTSTDRYGRTVALVYAGDMCANEAMVQMGAAWVYPQYCRQDYCREWYQEQQQARALAQGLWRDAEPVAPWQWRKDRRQKRQG